MRMPRITGLIQPSIFEATESTFSTAVLIRQCYQVCEFFIHNITIYTYGIQGSQWMMNYNIFVLHKCLDGMYNICTVILEAK